MEGVAVRDHNGIRVVRLHYTADPDKRSEEWARSAREGMSARQWRQEYEIDWHVAGGQPVYAEEFRREWHVAGEELLADSKLALWRGWDIGPTHNHPACVVCQVDDARRLMVLDEICAWRGRGAPRVREVGPFTEDVIYFCEENYSGASWIDYADPAGWTKSMTDGRSAIMVLNERGVHPRPGVVTFTERKEAMIKGLVTAKGGMPCILVSPTCRMVIEGFEGAYMYEELGTTGRFKPTVEKNAWSHAMDGLEYVAAAVFGVAPERGERVRVKRGKPERWTGY